MKDIVRIGLSIFVLSTLVAALFVLNACSGERGQEPEQSELGSFYSERGSQETIRVGYDGLLCQAPIALAHLKGFFEDEGLDTELIRTGDQNAVRDALAGGHLDVASGMIAAWLRPVTQGIDIRFTAGLHTGCASAFVLADSDIDSFEEGQDIAITGGVGGLFHNIGLRFIANDGFGADDFTWRDFPADQILIALQNGSVDLAVFPDNLGEQWIEDGTLRRIRSLHEDPDFKEEACCVLGIAGAFYDENPHTSERISRAVFRAAQWLDESDENKLEAAQLLIDEGYLSSTPEYSVQLMQLFQFALSHDTTRETLERTVVEYQALGIISEQVSPDLVQEQIWRPFNKEK